MERDSLITAKENREMFDGIAWRYDLMNRIVSLGMDRHWRRKAVDALQVRPGGRYLDVGIGTGDLSMEIMSREPDVLMAGIDHSRTMLKIANDKLKNSDCYQNATVEEGDALDLKYEDDSFDGVISGFCLRNLENRTQGLSEMARVTKKDGNIVVLELSVPAGNVVRQFHRGYNSTFVPVVAWLLSKGSAYQYLVESIKDFPHPDEILEKMDKAGFDKMAYLPLSRGIVSLFVGTPKKR